MFTVDESPLNHKNSSFDARMIVDARMFVGRSNKEKKIVCVGYQKVEPLSKSGSQKVVLKVATCCKI